MSSTTTVVKNWKHVLIALRTLRGGAQLPNATLSTGSRSRHTELVLTPAQRCGALLVAHRYDRSSILSPAQTKRDLRVMAESFSTSTTSINITQEQKAEALDMGIAALLLMKQKAGDPTSKSKILRAMFTATAQAQEPETVKLALECIEQALMGESRLLEEDARLLSDTVLSVIDKFPQFASPLFGLVARLPGPVPVSERFIDIILSLRHRDSEVASDLLRNVSLVSSSETMSKETALGLLEWACQKNGDLQVLRTFHNQLPALDDAASVRKFAQMLQQADRERQKQVLSAYVQSNAFTAQTLRDLLETTNGISSELIEDFVEVLTKQAGRTVALLEREGEETSRKTIATILSHSGKDASQFKRVLQLASGAPYLDSDFFMSWCEQNAGEAASAETRLTALNHILISHGLTGHEDEARRFERILRGCESSFSPLLVETWKQFHRWTSLEGIIMMLEEKKSQVSAEPRHMQRPVNALMNALRTCLHATGSDLTSAQTQTITDFVTRSAAAVPAQVALDILGDLFVLPGLNQARFEHILCALLEIISQNIKSDSACEAALVLLMRMLDLNAFALGENSRDGSAPEIINAVAKILQARRERRQRASVQELQKDDWADFEVFALAEKILNRMPCARGEELLPERTPLSAAKRLLLFAPRPPARANSLHNVKIYIAEMAQRDLLKDEENHPLALLAHVVKSAFPGFDHFGPNVHPVVTTQQSFDDLLVPEDHVSRRPSDTFYLSRQLLLRPHTSAHQTQFLRQGYTQFLVSGDVYRRDEIDKTHFPVFHQMEGVKVLPPGAQVSDAFQDLQDNLNRLADVLFPKMPRKWIDAYFPFTDPSLELEIEFRKKAVELLGCGVVHKDIMKNCGLEGRVAWAFGLGLERLAMLLFQIPDIRLFWSTDPRFLGQFENAKTRFLKNRNSVKFKSFSKFPPTKRDISFWLAKGTTNFHINDFFSIVREVAGDDVEEVSQVDDFVGPDGRKSVAFRILFRSDFKTLSGTEVNAMMGDIVAKLESQFSVTVR